MLGVEPKPLVGVYDMKRERKAARGDGERKGVCNVQEREYVMYKNGSM